MEKKFKPFFKWSGGKSKEFDKVVKWMPEKYDTFYEPFVGGGAIWLGLAPNKSVICDYYDEVTNFYEVLKTHGKHFIDECNAISKDYNDKFKKNVVGAYNTEIEAKEKALKQYIQNQQDLFFSEFDDIFLELNVNGNIQSKYKKAKKKKFKQVLKNDKKHNDLKKSLKKAREKGKEEYSENSDIFYNWRSMHNLTGIEKAKRFFVLRCLAYGGMLRFNSEGHFNVPYGFYKSFKSLSYPEDIGVLLNNSTIINDTWQNAVKSATAEDFVFLDPPYTREFKEYSSGNVFGNKEQEELAEYFKNSKSKCMIIINKDDFTHSLYKDYIKEEYPFNYSTKYRDRLTKQDNAVIHFVATNY
jgi:DNA adenine methylase